MHSLVVFFGFSDPLSNAPSGYIKLAIQGVCVLAYSTYTLDINRVVILKRFRSLNLNLKWSPVYVSSSKVDDPSLRLVL